MGGEVGEIGHLKTVATNDGRESGDLRMGEREEFFEEAKLVEEFEGGGMDGVAAEVAEEVFVLFKDSDSDALTREKEAEHNTGGASADDAAGSGKRIVCRGHL